MKNGDITVLGVGNILLRDEGVGIRVIQRLQAQYHFPDNVSLVDGGVLGLGLLNIVAGTDHLVVVDAVRNGGRPGDLYRLDGDAVPRRILAKNSLHQVDLLETLTASQILESTPETVILGVEPEDIETVSIELSPVIQEKVDTLIAMVLEELARLGVTPGLKKKEDCHVPGHTRQNHQH